MTNGQRLLIFVVAVLVAVVGIAVGVTGHTHHTTKTDRALLIEQLAQE